MSPQATAGFVQTTSRAFVDQLVHKGLIKDGFQAVLAGKDLDQVEQYLIAQKLLTGEQVAQEIATLFGLPYIHLLNTPISPKAVALIPVDVAKRFSLVGYNLDGLDLYLAVGRPAMLAQGAPAAIDQIRQQKGLRLHLSVAPEAEIMAVLQKIAQPAPASNRPEPVAAAVPTVKALNKDDLIKEVEPRERTVDLQLVQIPPATLKKIPYDVAKKYSIVVFESLPPATNLEPPLIKVAAVNEKDQHVKEILSYIQQRNKVLIEVYKTTPDSLAAALDGYAGAAAASTVMPDAKMPDVPIEPPKPIETPASSPLAVVPAEPNATAAEPVPPPPAVPTPGGSTVPGNITPSDQVIALKPEDITSLPSEVGGDLKKLAADEQKSLEDQNLDKLLTNKILSTQDLATVFKAGIVPKMVAATLFLAIQMRASDVHIEAERDEVRIRYRIDGILHDILRVPKFLHAPLISRIKILSKLKIDEQRVPQDGRFDVIIDARQVDLRVSTMPTVHGEKIVMRLLDKSEGIKSLEQLGVTGTNFDILVENIDKPYGIILSTGPTGSGKSTTLYAVLTRISKPGVNIVTLEDPVEYELPGINQAQVKPQIGFTFAEGLRSVLRQDPNVIMVGEIRDLETAGMATQAALTGHLVLSTLHTNDAAGALPRLIDMGVEPFLITSSINCVIGQRLVRKICDDCKEKVELPGPIKSFVKKQLAESSSAQLQEIDMDQLVFYHGKGCANCTNGYRGRIGIFEVLPMSDAIEDLAVRRAPASDIRKKAIADGMITMVQDGLIKALKGITTVDEVMRVTTTTFKDELPED